MDYRGNARIVKPDTLHALLDAMELPSATPAQIRDSDAQLNERERQRELPPMLTATQGRPRSLGAACGAAHPAKIILESGDVRTLPIVDTIARKSAAQGMSASGRVGIRRSRNHKKRKR